MPPPDATGTLSAESLRIAYGRTIVVDGLDVAVPARAFTALIGPNGSGKSTLLRAFAGLLRPLSGTIRLDGENLQSFSTKTIARRIGVLAQGPVAPEGLTVLELVQQGRYPHRSLFGRWSKADDETCADAMALTGMQALRDRPIDSLSGGQRQRAWIAMSLAQETPVLLLDEPTTFLDIAHQFEVMELIEGLVRDRGKTVVAVLHDLNQACRYASNLIAMKDGAIVAAGKPANIVDERLIESVFALPCMIVPDPVSRTPLIVAKRSRALSKPPSPSHGMVPEDCAS